MDQKIVRIGDRYDPRTYYYTVVCDEPQAAELEQLAKIKGFDVKVAKPDSYDAARKFLDQFET